MSLGQSRIDIILDGISPSTYKSNPPFLAVIFFLYGDVKLRRLNCTVGKELSSFDSLKSTCIHANSDKGSSLFLKELMLIYDVTLDEVNFRADIRQFFFLEKNQDIQGLSGS